MTGKAILFMIMSVLCLVGCSDSDSNGDNRLIIPSSEIKHLQIVQENSNVSPGEPHLIDYSYSRNELSNDVLKRFDEMSAATDNLYCSNDGVTYEMNITDNDGEIFTFVSNNRDCGRENEIYFIAVNEFENLLSMLE